MKWISEPIISDRTQSQYPSMRMRVLFLPLGRLTDFPDTGLMCVREQHEADVTSSWHLLFSKCFTKDSRFLHEDNGPGMRYDMKHPPHSSHFLRLSYWQLQFDSLSDHWLTNNNEETYY